MNSMANILSYSSTNDAILYYRYQTSILCSATLHMPPPQDDFPQAPDLENPSSGFAEVFRNLGTSRQNSSSSRPASIVTTDTATHPKLYRTTSRGEGLGQRARLSLGHLTKSEESIPKSSQPLDRLHRSQPISDRICAADEARSLMQNYPAELALKIWSAAKDLIGKNSSTESRKTGLELLISYVQHHNLSDANRRDLFHNLVTQWSHDNFALQLRALEHLSNQGRNIDPFQSTIIPLLPIWLRDCYRASLSARQDHRGEKGERRRLREDATFYHLFKLIIAVIESDPRNFREQDLVALLEEVSSICRRTNQEADVERCIDVLDAVTVFSHIPLSVLDTCMGVLCAIYGAVTKLAEPTWKPLSNLLRSSSRKETMAILLDIMKTPPNQCGRSINDVRGALSVVKQIICPNGTADLPDISFSTIVDALQHSLDIDHPRIDVVVLQVLNCLFQSEKACEEALKEDWTHLMAILLLSLRREMNEDEGDTRPDSSASSGHSPSSRSSRENNNVPQGLEEIINCLALIWPRFTSPQKKVVAEFLMNVRSRLTPQCADVLVRYYKEGNLCYPTNSRCLTNLNDLVEGFVVNRGLPPATRSLAISAFKDCFEDLSAKCSQESLSSYLERVLRCAGSETDVMVLDSLTNLTLHVTAIANDELFEIVLSALKDSSFQEDHVSMTPAPYFRSLVSSSPSTPSTEALPPQSPANTAVKNLVRILLRSLHTSAQQVTKIFEVLLDIARSKACRSDARLTAMRLLFRLRSDSNHSILVISTSESEEMAASLCRTVDTGSGARMYEDSSRDRIARNDESSAARLGRSSSVNQPQGYMPRSSTRSTSGPGRRTKLTPPLWMYPGPTGLPEDPPTAASPLLSSIADSSEVMSSTGRTVLKVNIWLEVVIGILQQGGDWEVYSYVLVHLGAQLANPSLFKGSIPQIKLLRNVLCEQMQASSFHDPPPASGLKKADVAICILHNITMLLAYHEHFARSEEDEIVRTFNSGIGSWDRASKICVNALLICCHEIPLSVTRSLNAVLQKMSQIITQSRVAMHVLEFLGGLARLPDVYVNLRDDELRTVFGICARYLQYSREERQKTPTAPSTRTSYASSRSSGTPKEFSMVTESEYVQTTSNDLPQYVYSLAYHVMTFWFLSLKLPDRAKHIGWITKNLVWTDDAGVEIIEEQSQVTIDMMQRTAFSDLGETVASPEFARSSLDPAILKKRWLVGMSIVTVETMMRSGLSQITKRQAVSKNNQIKNYPY